MFSGVKLSMGSFVLFERFDLHRKKSLGKCIVHEKEDFV